MKHLLNNLSNEEKNRIREQYKGGMSVNTLRFKKLLESHLGNVKPLLTENPTGGTGNQEVVGGGGQGLPQDKYSVTARIQNQCRPEAVNAYKSEAQQAPQVATTNKAGLPVKIDEKTIEFTKKLFDGMTYKGNIKYRYNCVDLDNSATAVGLNVNAAKPNEFTAVPTWVENYKTSVITQANPKGFLRSFCAYALTDIPIINSVNKKLEYCCKNGSGSQSSVPC